MYVKILRGLFSQNLVNLLLVDSTDHWIEERRGKKTFSAPPLIRFSLGGICGGDGGGSAPKEIFFLIILKQEAGGQQQRRLSNLSFSEVFSSLFLQGGFRQNLWEILTRKELHVFESESGRKKTLCSCMGNTNADSVKKIKKEKGKHGNQSSFPFRLMRYIDRKLFGERKCRNKREEEMRENSVGSFVCLSLAAACQNRRGETGRQDSPNNILLVFFVVSFWAKSSGWPSNPYF